MGKKIVIGGTPSKKQKEFFASRAKYTAYGGARGGGKSWALRRKLVGLCLNYPGIRCLLIRRSYAELKSNHLTPLLSEYGSLISYRESEKCACFDNGSKIFLGYCAHESDVLRYQGQEYDIIAIDEATQLTEYQFSIFKACLRGVNSHPKRIYLTCNPGGVGHSWVKRLFIDRDFRAGEDPRDYRFIRALVYDNEELLKSDPSYIGQLRALPERLRAAWLDGRWDVFEGQFFSEFSYELHVIDGVSIPKNNKRHFISFDYGFDRLAALLLSVGEGGELYVEKELCVSGLTLGEAARKIAGFAQGYDIDYAVASPDLWNRRQDSGKSGFEIMSAVFDMPPMVRADDRRIPGWRVLKEYLNASCGEPRLRISSCCEELIHCMQSLVCDPKRVEDASSVPHSITHAPEALRYAVMSRFEFASDAREQDDVLPFSFSCKKTKMQKYLDY